MKLERVGDGPILEPRKNVTWEKDAVLNAAAIHEDGKFHLFYRAVAHYPDARNRSCIGHAWSNDGVRFERADEPILRNDTGPENTVGVEDPRISKLGETYYLTYSCYNGEEVQIAWATSRDLDRWTPHGVLFGHEQFGNNKNAALFPAKIGGRYALIHRPMGLSWGSEPCALDMWLAFSDDLQHWGWHQRLLRCRRGEVDWEYAKAGLGGTPFRTESGWLMTYHAVDANSVYRLGLVLLDAEDPTVVLKRTAEPILEPEADWEVQGDVNNVVFTCGGVLLGTELWVYYGGADTVIGLAKGDASEFLER